MMNKFGKLSNYFASPNRVEGPEETTPKTIERPSQR